MAMIRSSALWRALPKTSFRSQFIIRRTLSSGQPIISRMPPGSWDSHMHVTSPDYPLATNAAYKPSLHSLSHAMRFEKTIGVPNIVLVQPSIYGNDNSCLLDALKDIGPVHGRGVVGFDPDTIDQKTLQDWHALGVRGVRLNYKSTNVQLSKSMLEKSLRRHADIVRPLNWVIELFIAMENIPMLEDLIPSLDAKFCIAHFGAPDLKSFQPSSRSDASNIPGFKGLRSLLQKTKTNTWVKFSAAYRFDPDAEMRGIEPIAKDILNVAGDRVVFASDWPHTRFEGMDVKPFVSRCLDWTDETDLTSKVFVENPRELWDA